jgi:hypothetical protein
MYVHGMRMPATLRRTALGWFGGVSVDYAVLKLRVEPLVCAGRRHTTNPGSLTPSSRCYFLMAIGPTIDTKGGDTWPHTRRQTLALTAS